MSAIIITINEYKIENHLGEKITIKLDEIQSSDSADKNDLKITKPGE